MGLGKYSESRRCRMNRRFQCFADCRFTSVKQAGSTLADSRIILRFIWNFTISVIPKEKPSACTYLHTPGPILMDLQTADAFFKHQTCEKSTKILPKYILTLLGNSVNVILGSLSCAFLMATHLLQPKLHLIRWFLLTMSPF